MALFNLMEISLTLYCQQKVVSIFTPRYLTLSIGYSLLPYNVTFKSPSNFFLLQFKDYRFSLNLAKFYRLIKVVHI